MLVLNSDGKRDILKGAVLSLTSSKGSFGQVIPSYYTPIVIYMYLHVLNTKINLIMS